METSAAHTLTAGDVDAAGDPSPSQRRRFVETLRRIAATSDRGASQWQGLRCYTSPSPTTPNPTVYSPAICIVAQGAKQATLGDRIFRYDPFHYLVITAPMPVHARVIEASDEEPYLSMSLDVDTSAVHDLLLEMEEQTSDEPAIAEDQLPLRVSRLDARLLDAVIRFLDAIADPMDRKILAPAVLREILYLALLRDQGDLLRFAARRDGRSPGVDRALLFIRHHLEERIDVPTIAREVGMSTSSLHHTFKSATTLTPIQYLKRMRLHRARQLMVDEGCLAAEAAFRVGYESPSQFSREFKRLFGLPPRRYIDGWSEPASA